MRDDSEAWRIAREQLWLITLSQLQSLGFSESAIRHRLRTGRLWRVYPGVFAVGHSEMTRERRWMAAALACGAGAAISHLTAAVHRRIWEQPPPIQPQVSVPSDHGRPGPSGIDLRRAPTLLETDVEDHLGIPTTTIERTICDNAHSLLDAQLKSMIRQAQRVHRLELRTLRAYVDAHSPRSHRHRRVARVLDAYLPQSALTETEREARFFELCAQHGIPLPVPQFRIGRHRADFAWPDLRLVVEIDDRESHDTAIAFGDDLVKDRALRAAGYEVLRFTVAELLSDPAMVARTVLDAVVRRRRAA